ncbi:MAG: Glycerol kinase, partial [uncultured Arthrobacter sp.]
EPVRRRHRPGHHQHPLHGLRPRRQGGLRRPEGARADLPARRVGRARRGRDLGQHPRGRGPGPGQGERGQVRPRRGRHHQPARDRGGLGPDHREARPQRHRVAGHAHPAHRRGARGAGRRRRPLQGEGGPAAGHLLRRAEGEVDPRQRRGRPRPGRERRPAHGHDRLVAAVEHDRWGRRRPAPDRRLERLAH